jgi:hypothetical protein
MARSGDSGRLFLGDTMRGEFKAFADETVDWVIFPVGRRQIAE